MQRLLLFAVFLLAAAPAHALKMCDSCICPKKGVFGIEAAGSDFGFYGRADKILSVSFHEYSTGEFLVAELVIDMADSPQQLRIYSARPPGSADALDRVNRGLRANAVDRGLDPSQATQAPLPGPVGIAEKRVDNIRESVTAGLVVKPWPVATHSKTIELSVPRRSEVLMLYRVLRDLMIGREVKGSRAPCSPAVSQSSAAAPASDGSSGGGSVVIKQISGTLFLVE